MAKKSRSRRRPAADESTGNAGDGSGSGTVEQVLGELESVVTDLESGDLPLETALERFEQGVKLARRGNVMLDAVEQRVEMLLADGEETVPFDGEEIDDD